ncbi:MAG TPA: hypothetical protein VFV30_08965 [Novosphingobium sp.]|nr:hypothetical protein [Novosphingobium sp.]
MTDTFPPNSRYAGVPLRETTLPDGTTRRFVGRRIIPQTGRYQALDRHRAAGDERIDGLAAASYGDPELYWRICDAGGDADPGEAAGPAGRLILIPLPLEMGDNGDT